MVQVTETVDTAPSLSTIASDLPAARSEAREPSSNRALYGTLLALITVLAAVLRFHALTAKSFWLDEGISIEFARLPWPQFLHVMWSGEGNMALYYLLLRFWLAIGSSEGFIRGLSVLFSVATIPLTFSLGARLFGRRVGLVAALLLSVNAYHIRYAQEARAYAMVVFFAVLATWLFERNLHEPSSARWEIYGVVCALSTYCHFFGALLVPAHAAALLFWRWDDIPWRKFTRSLLVFGAMVFPIAIFVLKAGTYHISWIRPMDSDSLLYSGFTFTGNYGRPLLALDLLAIGFAALGACRARRRGERVSEAWGYALLFSWLVVPFALVMTISLVKPIFVLRFLSFCLPALLLLVAVGISRLRPAPLAWALCAAISVCSLLGDRTYYRYDFDLYRQDWRAVAAYIFDRAQPGDNIFFYYSSGEAPFNYYSSQQKASLLRPKPLQEHWLKTGDGQDPSGQKLEDLVTVPGTNQLAAPPVGNRVWLVLMPVSGSKQEADMGRAVRNWLSNGHPPVDVQSFMPLGVVLFDRSAAGSLPGTRASSTR
jgi:mannosyltransferase